MWGVSVARVGLLEREFRTGWLLHSPAFKNLRQEAEGMVLVNFLRYIMTEHPDTGEIFFPARLETSLRGIRGENVRRVYDEFPALAGKVKFDEGLIGEICFEAGGERLSIPLSDRGAAEFTMERIKSGEPQ
jgi:hypothetical protein